MDHSPTNTSTNSSTTIIASTNNNTNNTYTETPTFLSLMTRKASLVSRLTFVCRRE